MRDERGVDGLESLPGWAVEEALVSGVPHRALAKRSDKAWAVLIDTPTLAIALTGPTSMTELSSGVVDVSDSLDRYWHDPS
jgi:hypothetical protein